MATVGPRKNDKDEVIGWQAKIRRRGFPVQSKTFEIRKTMAETEAKAGHWPEAIRASARFIPG